MNPLVEELKSYLQITWSEEDKDLEDMIQGGKDYLADIAGMEIDFDKDSISKQLLKDYCRYVYNHSLELFEVNFKRELFKLSIRKGVEAFEKANRTTDTSSV